MFSLPPPQHSPMLGHRASSQTVLSFNPRRSSFSLLKLLPTGISRLSHGGKRSRAFSPASLFNLPSYSFQLAASLTSPVTKFSNEGPSRGNFASFLFRRQQYPYTYFFEAVVYILETGRKLDQF